MSRLPEKPDLDNASEGKEENLLALMPLAEGFLL
jgi:hypothetical protein